MSILAVKFVYVRRAAPFAGYQAAACRGAPAVRKPPSLGYAYPKLGSVGKEKMQQRCFSSYPRQSLRKWAAPSAVIILLGSCAAGPPSRYAGTLTPISGTCDQPGRAILTRTEHHVQFVPYDGVIILPGVISQAGEIRAALAARGTATPLVPLLFSGQVRGNRITGTYSTPRCRYAADLAPVAD